MKSREKTPSTGMPDQDRGRYLLLTCLHMRHTPIVRGPGGGSIPPITERRSQGVGAIFARPVRCRLRRWLGRWTGSGQERVLPRHRQRVVRVRRRYRRIEGEAMRHFMVDPDNTERLLKIPPNIVAAIKAEVYMDVMDAIDEIRKGDQP